MPLFEYICEKCNVQSEVLVLGSARPKCPECGSARLKKQASMFAAVAASRSAMEPLPGECAASGCQAAGGACPYQP